MRLAPSDLYLSKVREAFFREPEVGNLEVIVFGEIPSTMQGLEILDQYKNELNSLSFSSCLPFGLVDKVFFAEDQTAGRGRGKREWHSEKDKGIYFTFVTKEFETQFLDQLNSISLIVGLSLANVFKQYKIGLNLKWPNDLGLYRQGEFYKLAGILSKSRIISTNQVALTIGVGINVFSNLLYKSLGIADFVGLESLNEFDIVFDFIEEFEQNLNLFCKTGFGDFVKKYEDLLNKEIDINFNAKGNLYKARFRKIDSFGRLIVKSNQFNNSKEFSLAIGEDLENYVVSN